MKYTSLELDDTIDELESTSDHVPVTRFPPPSEGSAAVATRRQQRLLILSSMAGFFMLVGALSMHNPETTTADGFIPQQALRGSVNSTTTTTSATKKSNAFWGRLPGNSSSSNSASTAWMDDNIAEESSLRGQNQNVVDPCTVYGSVGCLDSSQQESLFDEDEGDGDTSMVTWNEEVEESSVDTLESSKQDETESYSEYNQQMTKDSSIPPSEQSTEEEAVSEDKMADVSGNEPEPVSEESSLTEDVYAHEEWASSIQETAPAEDKATVARMEDEDNHGH